ncbi:MAG: phage tail family protein [Tissierellales bacterium]|jgi:hypothetical protein|nr:phage tail family protein [Tissierellales bacterium]
MKVTYINKNGDKLEFGNRAPFVFKSIEGLEFNSIVRMTKAPKQIGKSFDDLSIDERLVTISFALISEDESGCYSMREKLLKVTNPLIGPGKLVISTEYMDADLEVITEKISIPDLETLSGNILDGMFHLVAPNPLFLKQYEESSELSFLMGGMKMFKLPTGFSLRGKKRKILNNGQISTPVKIAFHGPGTKPRVNNLTTGEFIEINSALEDGDILFIDTTDMNKSVRIKRSNGSEENAFGQINLDSTFWKLVQGENILSYESRNDSQKTKVEIKFKERLIGL